MIILPSLLRSTGGNKVFGTSDYLGGLMLLDVSAVSAGTLNLKLQHKDPVSGNFVDIVGASFAAKTGTGTDSLVVFPGVAEVANRKVSTAFGDEVNVVYTVTGGSVTFSLACDELRSD